MTMNLEVINVFKIKEMFHYIRRDIIRDCINEYGIDGTLPDLVINRKIF